MAVALADEESGAVRFDGDKSRVRFTLRGGKFFDEFLLSCSTCLRATILLRALFRSSISVRSLAFFFFFRASSAASLDGDLLGGGGFEDEGIVA